MSYEHFEIFPPDEHSDEGNLIGDLRLLFPNEESNHEITALVAAALAAEHPEVAEQIDFDPEMSCFYAYGTVEHLEVLASVIEVTASNAERVRSRRHLRLVR